MGLQVDKPLIEGFWLPKSEKGRRWINVRYERLFDFCFACGLLGHLLKNCGEDAKMLVVDGSQLQYGSGMRVVPVKYRLMRGGNVKYGGG